MSEPADELARLREALAGFGEEHAAELVAAAREEALARARSILATEMTRALLAGAGTRLGGGRGRARAARPSPAPERPGETGDRLLYVYGVAAAGDGALDVDLNAGAGVAGAAPFALPVGELRAIVSSVPAAEFDEAPLRENLNDVEWLERVARAHEDVLERARRTETVVPLRLCTLYRDEEHLRGMLGGEAPVFLEALARLRGRTEWGVKMIAEPGALTRGLGAAGSEQLEGLPAGVAYLRERGREARAQEAISELAARWAADVHDELAARAEEALLNPLQNREVSGHAGDMLLNGAYLVADAELPAFREECERLAAAFAERGVAVELTGPWPPYNFVQSPVDAAR